MTTETQRFKFIGHALEGDGPFRPVITYDSTGKPISAGTTYLIKYPRESEEKFSRRCELAFYASPMARVCGKFSSYISTKPVQRDIRQDLLQAIQKDTDGRGNQMDVFWSAFMVDAKARGSMLLLIDMPQVLPDNLSSQLSQRASPYWTPVKPELLVDFAIADDGKFEFAEFTGNYTDGNGMEQPCTWYFNRVMWACKNKDGTTVQSNAHPLGECPLLIFTESGTFPSFGPFAPIADLSKRVYNLSSELDEILRSQTFSLLTMQVPEDSADESRLEAAKIVGETIGTNNLMMHSGSTPSFIAPADGPANIYREYLMDLRAEINEIGLEVATPNQRESGISMQMRFQTINAELSRFSQRIEGLEQRAWELSARWLGFSDEAVPVIAWPRDFNIADPEQELDILRSMQETAMPASVINAQQKRVVVTQFSGMDQEAQDDIIADVDSEQSAV